MNIKQLLRPRDAWIFDLDGVLVHSYECWFRLMQDATSEQGRAPVTREEFDRSWGQGPEADQQMFFPGWELHDVMRYYDTNFHKYTKLVQVDQEAVDFLRHLKAHGKKIGVASNSTRSVVEGLLQQCGALVFVDAFVGVEEVGESKPAPDLIYKAMERLGTTAAKTVYVGDSVFDQKAAAAACVLFIGYRREGDIHIRRFSDLIGALGG